MIRIQDAGTLRTITRGSVRVAGVTRALRTIKVMDGGVLRTVAVFADPLSVSISPSALAAFAQENTTVTTDTASASPTGGLAPFTYAWTLQANGGGTASTANSASSATTSFTKTNVPLETTYSDTWRVTVTDAVGQTATANIIASFTNFSFT